MKKAIATLSIILILLNAFVPQTRADISHESVNKMMGADISHESVNKMMGEGTAGLPTKEGEDISFNDLYLDTMGNNFNSLVTAFLEILIVPPMIVNWLMSLVATNGQDTYTIQDMLLNKYYLFDIDFFDSSGDSLSQNDPNKEIINTLKENVSIWYFTLRNISMIGSALIIIYVAIRIALELAGGGGPKATAKYKKMLTSWAIGFILLCILPYLVKAIFWISDWFTSFIYNAIESDTESAKMEVNIINNSWDNFKGARGMDKLVHVVLYYVLVFYEIKFFLMYLKRVFQVFFLMIISPLVCMLYPIDKIGDGRSQSFDSWFSILLNQILLRPIQLLVYAIFIATASEIAVIQPIVAVLFFMALSNGEKIIKKIIGIGGPNIADQKGPNAGGLKKLRGMIPHK